MRPDYCNQKTGLANDDSLQNFSGDYVLSNKSAKSQTTTETWTSLNMVISIACLSNLLCALSRMSILWLCCSEADTQWKKPTEEQRRLSLQRREIWWLVCCTYFLCRFTPTRLLQFMCDSATTVKIRQRVSRRERTVTKWLRRRHHTSCSSFTLQTTW